MLLVLQQQVHMQHQYDDHAHAQLTAQQQHQLAYEQQLAAQQHHYADHEELLRQQQLQQMQMRFSMTDTDDMRKR